MKVKITLVAVREFEWEQGWGDPHSPSVAEGIVEDPFSFIDNKGVDVTVRVETD